MESQSNIAFYICCIGSPWFLRGFYYFHFLGCLGRSNPAEQKLLNLYRCFLFYNTYLFSLGTNTNDTQLQFYAFTEPYLKIM